MDHGESRSVAIERRKAALWRQARGEDVNVVERDNMDDLGLEVAAALAGFEGDLAR